EGDIVAVRDALGTVVLLPAAAVCHFHLVAAGGQLRGGPLVAAVPVRVMHPGGHAVRLPVSGASGLLLEAARQGHDRSLGGVGEVVADRIVEEGDRTAVVGVGHVVTVRHGAGPVVLLPAAAHGHLVLVVARGQVEGAGVDTVLTERQRGRGAVRRPVAATAHGRVVAAGHGDELLGGLLRCRGAIERLAHRTASGGGDAVPGRIHGHA